jgi:hypothetical protein
MLTIKPVFGLRPFNCGHYSLSSPIAPRPLKPLRCPFRRRADNNCQIVSKGFRPRKTAPFHFLSRFLCKFHRHSFTVYPIGMVPYGRKSFLELDQTIQCIRDATHGIRWPEMAIGGEVFKTQKRWILGWSQLVGCEPDQAPRVREDIADSLGISVQLALDAANKIREGPTYRGRAQAVSALLQTFLGGTSIATLLQRGTKLYFWGKANIDERENIPLFDCNILDGRPPNLSSPYRH